MQKSEVRRVARLLDEICINLFEGKLSGCAVPEGCLGGFAKVL